jgi:hypothetical protein
VHESVTSNETTMGRSAIQFSDPRPIIRNEAAAETFRKPDRIMEAAGNCAILDK